MEEVETWALLSPWPPARLQNLQARSTDLGFVRAPIDDFVAGLAIECPTLSFRSALALQLHLRGLPWVLQAAGCWGVGFQLIFTAVGIGGFERCGWH